MVTQVKVIEAKPVARTEAKEIMLSRENEKELGYEQKLAVEHLKKFTKLKHEGAKKLAEEISSILRINPETLAQIIDVLPKTPDEVRMIFARERFSLKEDEIVKIIEAVKKYI